MGKSSRGLGKGLEALFRVEEAEKEAMENNNLVKDVDLSELRPNPYQPRKAFNEESLKELKESIISNGIIQPLIVRKSSVRGYEIIAGERRFRAAKLAKLTTVPVVVKDFLDSQMMEVALIENLQRENLSPIEEAEAYLAIMKRLSYTQEVLAERMGKSRSHVANYLRLLSLPTEVRKLLSNGALSIGHAKVLLGLKNQEQLIVLAKKTVEQLMSVRELERVVEKILKSGMKESKDIIKNISKDQLYKKRYLQEQTALLCEKLGTKVHINTKNNKIKGKIEINFLSEEDLERLLSQIVSK